jgi:hypothetical protein
LEAEIDRELLPLSCPGHLRLPPSTLTNAPNRRVLQPHRAPDPGTMEQVFSQSRTFLRGSVEIFRGGADETGVEGGFEPATVGQITK